MFKNKNSNIKIICKKHGMFKQLASLHWSGNGCPDCEDKKLTSDAVNRFIDIHGDTYDYSLVNYKNNQTKISIICKTHGEFKQTPNNHQSKKHGCPICGAIRQGNIGNTSALEYKIIELLKHNNIQFKHSDRTVVFPQELDIIIPYKNIAIEINGNYWHSETFKTKTYHIDKTLACSNKNIQLLQFWEHEINNNFKLVSSMIMAKLGQSKNRIFARKCVIKVISSADAKSFEDYNHLQGACIAKIKLGLFYNNDLVSLMTFSKPRFNKNYEWELIRFCNKINNSVVGGASKLFKYFIKNYTQENDKIISYANLRISNGNLYEALGFTKIGLTPPNYFYFGNKGILQRYQAQKHKLEKLLGSDNFDENLTEHKNMHNNKYYRVYDCGNLVFEYNINTNGVS